MDARGDAAERPRRANRARLGRARRRLRERRGRDASRSLAQLRHMLRLDEDLSAFYAVARDDPDLAWAASGAGRMLRSPTVFEDVVKTICTTNCAWGGDRADGHRARRPPRRRGARRAGARSRRRRRWPRRGEDFYRDVARAGYRGAYLRTLADDVASGALDLEELNDPELPGRRDRGAAARAAGRRPVRRRARDADVARPLLAARARLVDATDVREARRPQGRGQDDRAQVPPLRRLRRASRSGSS